ncbi:YfiR family protein [Ekhidna sp.]|uniref:YfiR family protein n=1 Tax=Ekhidna sp. TaxID=2608089 RepID=UPI003B509021
MRSILIFIGVLLVSSLGMNASAQVGKFQALYLVNFTKNLDWPGENVTIGVVGNSKALIELESLVSKYPNISIKKISGSESIRDCQLIFLPTAQSRNISLIQSKIGSLPIVLVAEDRSLVSEGAEIGFYMEGNKLKFVINKSALDDSGISASEKLLSVAKIVN